MNDPFELYDEANKLFRMIHEIQNETEIKDSEKKWTKVEDEMVVDKYDRHKNICNELHELYLKKNADYGDSFGRGFSEYGMIMPIIRLEDKLSRVKRLSLSIEQNVKDESIRDTLIDLANYAIMTIVELEESRNAYK